MKRIYYIYATLILAFIGGFFDTYALFYRGGKYFFLQTGNLINIGIDLINKNYEGLILGLSIFFTFIVGLVIGFLIDYFFSKKKINKLILLTLILIFMIPSYFYKETIGIDYSLIAIVFMAIVGGILLESFRNYSISFTSTMMTNNMKLMTDSLLKGGIEHSKVELKKGFFYLGIILSFFVGVIVVVILYEYSEMMIMVPLIGQLLILSLIVLEIINLKKGEENEE